MNWRLTLYLLRSVWPVTVLAWLVSIPLVLLYRDVIWIAIIWLDLFVLVHSAAIVTMLSRFRSGEFAFLRGRGFSRDVLWRHTMQASLLAVLGVWLPVALAIWTPLRATVQDSLQNPLFPFMAKTEHFAPWLWLGMYAVLLPVFHWVAIRLVLPGRAGLAGVLLATGAVIAIFDSISAALRIVRSAYGDERTITMVSLTVLIALLALIASWRMHRRLEVQA